MLEPSATTFSLPQQNLSLAQLRCHKNSIFKRANQQLGCYSSKLTQILKASLSPTPTRNQLPYSIPYYTKITSKYTYLYPTLELDEPLKLSVNKNGSIITLSHLQDIPRYPKALQHKVIVILFCKC